MKNKIFQAIFVSTDIDGKTETIVYSNEGNPVSYVLAKNEQEATMKATRLLSDQVDLERIEIVLRPF